MNTTHLIIGIIAVFWGSGMIYFSRAKNIPSLVKPLIHSWWIKSKSVNNAIAFILGLGTVICGFLFILGGLAGRKILPFP